VLFTSVILVQKWCIYLVGTKLGHLILVVITPGPRFSACDVEMLKKYAPGIKVYIPVVWNVVFGDFT